MFPEVLAVPVLRPQREMELGAYFYTTVGVAVETAQIDVRHQSMRAPAINQNQITIVVRPETQLLTSDRTTDVLGPSLCSCRVLCAGGIFSQATCATLNRCQHIHMF